MSIFGGSDRFPVEAARSPGPIYSKPDIRANARVVMKADYRPVDENQKWGKRESWISGPSPHIPVVNKDSSVAPGYYNDNFRSIKSRAPTTSFSKSDRFISQKVSMSGVSHQRELIAAESPGPKYNVDCMSANGGRTVQPKFSFAAPSSPNPQKTRLPEVGPPRGHRESWMSVLNRNGVLVMPASPARPRQAAKKQTAAATPEETRYEEPAHRANNNASGKNSGNAFGHEHRFGKRQSEVSNNSPVASSVSNTRVQFVSATHTRENMGEFSPGPIYAAYNPERPGGKLAPAPRRPAPPGSPSGPRYPHANRSSRSSWLAGAVRKCDGKETVLLRMGDMPPGPGSYAGPPSSFIKVSHNVKSRPNPTMQIKSPRPLIRPPGVNSAREQQRQRDLSAQKGNATARPAEATGPEVELL